MRSRRQPSHVPLPPAPFRLTLDHAHRITDSSIVTLAESFFFCSASVTSFYEQERDQLTSISLRCCKKLTDTAVLALAKCCPLLREVDLGELDITDDAVVALLARCVHLSDLNVFACVRLTNRSLTAAEAAEKLEHLNIHRCGLLTNDAIDALKACRPGLQINVGVSGMVHMGTSEVISGDALERLFDGGAATSSAGAPPAAATDHRASAPPPMPLVGKRVRILGLQARPELNGKLAIAESYVASKGRYGVKLPDGTTTLALKPANLEEAGEEAEDAMEVS